MTRSCIAVPDVEDAVPVDDLIANLKRDIESDCRTLLQRAQVIQGAVNSGRFRFRHWEGKVNEIRKAQISTYNIEKLKQLQEQCAVISVEMEEFSKSLS
jgi:hypothetical protein